MKQKTTIFQRPNKRIVHIIKETRSRKEVIHHPSATSIMMVILLTLCTYLLFFAGKLPLVDLGNTVLEEKEEPLPFVELPLTLHYYLNARYTFASPFEYQACLTVENNRITKIFIMPEVLKVEWDDNHFLNGVVMNCNKFDGNIHSHPNEAEEPSTMDRANSGDERISCVHAYADLEVAPRCFSYGEEIEVRLVA